MIQIPASWSRAPIRPLSIAWLVTIVAMVAFLWCAYDSYRRFAQSAQQNLRVQELRGRIIHLDELLTMSARMSALTGDPRWEARYREFEPQLGQSIKEVLKYPLGVRTSRQTDEANEALVQMEDRSFELTRQGKPDQAKALLLSDDYAAKKSTYADGMNRLGRDLGEAADAAVRAEHRRILIQLGVGAAIIAALVGGWFMVVRVARQGMQLRTQLDKIERDLDIAREIQRGLLPTAVPHTPGFAIEGWSKPADQTGGDYFDWMALPNGGTLITLADVTGHGIGPALIVSVCRAYMRAAAVTDGVVLEDAISRVNDLLQADLPPERFVTAAVGVLQPETNEMSLVSAGQAPLFFYRAASRSVENWAADDVPLGVMPGMTLDGARKIRFEPGDALVLTTDGFFEWANPAGEQFGIQRLEAFVQANAHEPSAAFIQALHGAVLTHAAGQVQPDDLTVVIVRRLAAVGSSAREQEGIALSG